MTEKSTGIDGGLDYVTICDWDKLPGDVSDLRNRLNAASAKARGT